MTSQEKIAFKNRLKQTGLQLISDRIAMAKSAGDNAQAAANSEDKSSAGDKYETGRAMGHLEKDMYARQQAENVKELARFFLSPYSPLAKLLQRKKTGDHFLFNKKEVSILAVY